MLGPSPTKAEILALKLLLPFLFLKNDASSADLQISMSSPLFLEKSSHFSIKPSLKYVQEEIELRLLLSFSSSFYFFFLLSIFFFSVFFYVFFLD